MLYGVSATGRSVVQRSPADCSVSNCVKYRNLNNGAAWPRVVLLRHKEKILKWELHLLLGVSSRLALFRDFRLLPRRNGVLPPCWLSRSHEWYLFTESDVIKAISTAVCAVEQCVLVLGKCTEDTCSMCIMLTNIALLVV
jgi:hypothetical protein